MKAKSEFKVGKHSIGYLYDSFTKRFGDETFEKVSVPPRAITLPRTMNDAEIESELKPGLCTLGDVLTVLDSTNETFKDGNWNLFYFPACVVLVGWGAGDRTWGVDGWGRGDDGWHGGGRVFSPATDRPQPSALSDLTLESLDARLKKLESFINSELLK